MYAPMRLFQWEKSWVKPKLMNCITSKDSGRSNLPLSLSTTHILRDSTIWQTVLAYNNISGDAEKSGSASSMVHNEKCNVIKSAIIGTAIGIMPGAGCDIAAFVAYGEAKRNAKEKFGTGVPSGIVAPETANNAAIGGAFVPLLALGIPGSNAAALISGALTIHGCEFKRLRIAHQTHLRCFV